jgi:hypothetical protein
MLRLSVERKKVNNMPIDWSKLNEEQLNIAKQISTTAKDMGVDPDHILPLAYAENQFKATGKSDKGAIGPMQLMPRTAKGLGVDPNKLDENIRGGVTYFKQLYEHPEIKGNLDKAYAAYNAGPDTPFVKSGNLKDLPDETLVYLDRIRKVSGQKEMPKADSPAAPIESLDVNEVVDKIPGEVAPQPAAENAGETEGRGQFDFDMDAFKEKQAKAAAAAPYGHSLEQDIPAGILGAQTGLGLGTAYTLGKTYENLANAPQTIANAVRNATSGSTNAVRNWITEMGGKDRGGKDYKQAHQYEQGVRQGATRVDPATGREIKPKFRFARPPVVDAASEVSALQKAGNLGKAVLTSPIARGTLGGLGIGMGGAETVERYNKGDTLGTALSGLSTAGSAASMVPGFQIPGTAVALGGQGALYAADTIRNKLAQEAQNPPPPVTQAELDQANRPVGGFYPQKIGRNRTPQQIQQMQQQLTGNLLQSLNGQLSDFSKPPQLPSQKQPQR